MDFQNEAVDLDTSLQVLRMAAGVVLDSLSGSEPADDNARSLAHAVIRFVENDWRTFYA